MQRNRPSRQDVPVFLCPSPGNAACGETPKTAILKTWERGLEIGDREEDVHSSPSSYSPVPIPQSPIPIRSQETVHVARKFRHY